MYDYLKLILFPVLVIVGWSLGERNFDLGRRFCLALGLVLAWHLLVLGISGWWEDVTAMPEVHRWTGQSLVVASWLCTPLAIGVALGAQFRRRVWLALGKTVVALATLGVVLLASFTGYLDPSLDEATMNRFEVWHTMFLPGICLLLLLLWCGLYAPPLKRNKESPEP